MKNSYKVALLAALGLVTVSSARAFTQGDVLLGLTDNSTVNTSAHNDYVIDIGSLNQFTSTSIKSGTLSASSIASVVGTDSASSVNHLAFGVIGGTSGGVNQWNQSGAYTGPVTGTAIAGSASLYTSVALGVTPSGNGSSWTSLVSANPNTGSTDVSGGIDGNTGNPMVFLSGGTASAAFLSVVYDGTDTQNPTQLGTFAINLSNDTWTYNGLNATAVPEPSTYGLIAVAGVLLVGVRRQFVKKNA